MRCVENAILCPNHCYFLCSQSINQLLIHIAFYNMTSILHSPPLQGDLEHQRLVIQAKPTCVFIGVLPKIVVPILGNEIIIIEGKQVVLILLAPDRDKGKRLPLLIKQALSINIAAAVDEAELVELRLDVKVDKWAVLCGLNTGAEDTRGRVRGGIIIKLPVNVGGITNGEDICVAIERLGTFRAAARTAVSRENEEAAVTKGQNLAGCGGALLALRSGILRERDNPLTLGLAIAVMLAILLADFVFEQAGVLVLVFVRSAIVDRGALKQDEEGLALGVVCQALEALVVVAPAVWVLRVGDLRRVVDGRVVGGETLGAIALRDESVRRADHIIELALLGEVVEEWAVLVRDPESAVLIKDKTLWVK